MRAKNSAENFWSNVARGDPAECWAWTRFRNPEGYGRVMWHGKVRNAQRVAYALTHPEWGWDKCVLHSCDNPPCCNPAHLWLGTDADNAADKARKKRVKLMLGEHNPRAKLTDEQARQILASPLSYRQLAAAFGVTYPMIGHIKRGRNWQHLHAARSHGTSCQVAGTHGS